MLVHTASVPLPPSPSVNTHTYIYSTCDRDTPEWFSHLYIGSSLYKQWSQWRLSHTHWWRHTAGRWRWQCTMVRSGSLSGFLLLQLLPSPDTHLNISHMYIVYIVYVRIYVYILYIYIYIKIFILPFHILVVHTIQQTVHTIRNIKQNIISPSVKPTSITWLYIDSQISQLL